MLDFDFLFFFVREEKLKQRQTLVSVKREAEAGNGADRRRFLAAITETL